MRFELLNLIKEIANGVFLKKEKIQNLQSENINVAEEGYDTIDYKSLEEVTPGKVYYYSSTLSTNIKAKQCECAPDKSVFIAETQTAGRGRLGRSWTSPTGCGIWMSISLKPRIASTELSKLTLLAGLAVSRVIPGSEIKWPNDVLINGRKVCGILTELTADTECAGKVAVGVGINVNNDSFPTELEEKATSLYIETGNKVNRTELTKKILKEFFDVYDDFLKRGSNIFLNEYRKKCVTLGKEIVIIKNDRPEKARAVDISEDGELVTEREGVIETVNSGEVSVRGLLGYN